MPTDQGASDALVRATCLTQMIRDLPRCMLELLLEPLKQPNRAIQILQELLIRLSTASLNPADLDPSCDLKDLQLVLAQTGCSDVHRTQSSQRAMTQIP